MNAVKQRRVSILIVFQTLLCCIKGLLLYPASDLTAQSFTLVCDLQGIQWKNAIIFNYNGTYGGACSSPPNPACTSSIGTISHNSQMVIFTLNQNEIMQKGNALWDCTHGIEPAYLNTTIIALCTNIEVNYADEKMDISCNCGFPNVQAELEYKDSQNGDTLRSQTFDLTSSPGTNCTTDTRAKDYSYKIENFPSGTVEVCATIRTVSQTTTPKTICKLVQDCIVDIFLCGFLPVFLIVLTVSIVFIIILKKECLPKQFGELTKKKLGIIVAFILVAIIIGLCLGLLIKRCDKKFLALGLSILFAIIIVVAFILTLFFYHKKFESRKDYHL